MHVVVFQQRVFILCLLNTYLAVLFLHVCDLHQKQKVSYVIPVFKGFLLIEWIRHALEKSWRKRTLKRANTCSLKGIGTQ